MSEVVVVIIWWIVLGIYIGIAICMTVITGFFAMFGDLKWWHPWVVGPFWLPVCVFGLAAECRTVLCDALKVRKERKLARQAAARVKAAMWFLEGAGEIGRKNSMGKLLGERFWPEKPREKPKNAPEGRKDGL